jgi:predicted dehydrogenase
MRRLVIIGTGFVADLYAASLKTFSDIEVVACYDHDQERLMQFCSYWNMQPAPSLKAALACNVSLVLNLTNPHAHFEITRQALQAGKNVYSEKPIATDLESARILFELARDRGLQLASAPCSLLSQTAQTFRAAIESGVIGTPRLAYAELDDNFISQAPLKKWKSESGAPWPIEDELLVGCTLEHAGYYLTWLMAIFGPVRTVVAASGQLADVSEFTTKGPAPDYSSATLFFAEGMVVRITCSIIAPHDHRLRVFGDSGVLSVSECWDNFAPVKVRRRHKIRRRLIDSPIAKTVRPPAASSHPSVRRRGAASMNFMLGPAEMLDAITAGRESSQAGDFALHLTEVSLSIQSAGNSSGAQHMQTSFKRFPPTRWYGERTTK